MKKYNFTWKVSCCAYCGSCDVGEDNMSYWCNGCKRVAAKEDESI